MNAVAFIFLEVLLTMINITKDTIIGDILDIADVREKWLAAQRISGILTEYFVCIVIFINKND